MTDFPTLWLLVICWITENIYFVSVCVNGKLGVEEMRNRSYFGDIKIVVEVNNFLQVESVP